MRCVYPWSAVVGQERLKRALVLCAIDPAIGGVLVQGPRGVAKTTLARALAELCAGRFVELPLGATEERVTGTLELQAALRDGEVAFSPGLLARAHDGLLYVDEINLLPDGLVDVLLDAAASGQNVVERDGISHVHPARFVLIGTMNPEEGELRPQLSDRFGLSVRAEEQIAPPERREILRRRLAYDRDPEAFVARYAESQQALVERCRQARAQLASIELSDRALDWVTERCHAAGVEGVRADLAMLRAARAHAAWEGRSEIVYDDVAAVVDFALAHRLRGEPGARGGGSQQGTGSPPSERGSPTAGGSSSRHAAPAPRGGGAQADSGRALAPVPVRVGAEVALPGWLTRSRVGHAERRRRGVGRTTAERGVRAGRAPSGVIDWFATLARTRRPARADLRFRQRRAPHRALWVSVIDCSASMLRSGALSLAKSTVLAFEAAAGGVGAHLAVISFQGTGARLVANTGEQAAQRLLAVRALGAGGGTPLRAALQQTLALCTSARFARAQKRVVLLTDGRTSEPFPEPSTLPSDISFVVIDCERGPVRIGRTRDLGAALGACTLHVDTLQPRRAQLGLPAALTRPLTDSRCAESDRRRS